MGRKQEDLRNEPEVQSPTQSNVHLADTHTKDPSGPSPRHCFEQALHAALTDHKIAEARTLVAKAEAEIYAGRGTGDWHDEPIRTEDLAAAKARIAMSIGDRSAARAILVQAIEANSKAPSLRALMTEVMMADGRASDVRPILRHLGNAPTTRTRLDEAADCPEPKARDTSA